MYENILDDLVGKTFDFYGASMTRLCFVLDSVWYETIFEGLADPFAYVIRPCSAKRDLDIYEHPLARVRVCREGYLENCASPMFPIEFNGYSLVDVNVIDHVWLTIGNLAYNTAFAPENAFQFEYNIEPQIETILEFDPEARDAALAAMDAERRRIHGL